MSCSDFEIGKNFFGLYHIGFSFRGMELRRYINEDGSDHLDGQVALTGSASSERGMNKDNVYFEDLLKSNPLFPRYEGSLLLDSEHNYFEAHSRNADAFIFILQFIYELSIDHSDCEAIRKRINNLLSLDSNKIIHYAKNKIKK